MSQFVDGIRASARLDTRVVIDGQQTSWSEIHELARSMARRVRHLGVRPGSRVAVASDTDLPTVALIQGLWLTGAAVTMLHPPGRAMGLDAWLVNTVRTLSDVQADLLITGSQYEGLSVGLTGHAIPVVPLDSLQGVAANEPSDRLPEVTEEQIALIQLSSGTTSEAKAIAVSHGRLLTHLQSIAAASDHDRIHGVMLSWLPLYHDMGMIGFFTLCMWHGCNTVLIPPTRFANRPQTWLEAITRYEGTATAAPNFAYALASRLIPRLSGIKLDSMRFALSGGEPIRPRDIQAFLGAAGGAGFPPGAFVPAYGMAECVLAISMAPPGQGLLLAEHDGREDVLLGPPLPGLRVQVDTSTSSDGSQAGAILVQGSDLADHYLVQGKPEPLLNDSGLLDTGDVGYLHDGQIVVSGRSKDVVIIGGRNIYPTDVEYVAEQVAGVRPGGTVALREDSSWQSRERLVLLVESPNDGLSDLKSQVGDAVVHALGLRPDVRLVPKGSIPKTSSGKIRRSEARRTMVE